MRTRPIRAPLNIANCVHSIACECGKSYIGETRRQLVVRLREHRQNLRRKSFGKIHSATCIWRESPHSLEKSQEFRDRNKFIIQQL